MGKGERTFEQRLDETVELAVQIASGNLEARLLVSERGDPIDAVVAALNMLADELAHERKGRQRAEELLQDELDAYENAPALFCSLDGQSLTIENCNQTLAAALGLPKPQIIGRSVLDLCSEDCRDLVERSLRELAVGAPHEGPEARLDKATGGHVTVSTGASRVRGHDGRERLRIVWRDVTLERHLEAQLVQAQKLSAVGRLCGGVAHDFNNILSVVTGAAALLSAELSARSIETEDIDLIQQAVARGASLTSDLLAFSRRQVVKPTTTDVRSVMRETERMIERLVGADIQVIGDPQSEPLCVLIDASQLSQVLINLAINARDAMGEGGRLSIAAARLNLDREGGSGVPDLPPGAYARISVSDTGSGMTNEVLSQVFEPFFTTKPPGSGSGLGLSVCYGIIRQAGGRISIDSGVGQGTSVKIYLPISASEASPALAPGRPPARGGRETILVVEDDVAVCMVTRRILERAGYRVLVATNGVEALEVADRLGASIDLVVSDVTMPGMGGIELGVELRRQRPTTRLLYLSGYPRVATVKPGSVELGAEFLGKPFTSSALLESVRRALDIA